MSNLGIGRKNNHFSCCNVSTLNYYEGVRKNNTQLNNTMTKFIKIVISKKGKTLYYRGDGFWFGRCSEAYAKEAIANGISVWEVNVKPAMISGFIAG